MSTGWEDGLGLQTTPLSAIIGQDAVFWRCQALSLSSYSCVQSIAHTQTSHGTELQVANGHNIALEFLIWPHSPQKPAV